MNPDDALRFARQIALPQIGPDGQTRICLARVLVIGGDLAAETAARYLEAGGVGLVIRRAALPEDGPGWLAALGVFDLVVRSGFDDDAMLGAAARLGLPVVVVRGRPDQVDLVSYPRRAPAPEAPLEVPPQFATPSDGGAAAVLAGALAAAEALTLLARGADPEKAGNPERVPNPSREELAPAEPSLPHAGAAPGATPRLLRLPLDGGDPLTQQVGAP